MVKGIKGHAQATHQGTLKWYIEDDHGLVHVMVITGAYLIPDTTTRILSPQHLAEQANDRYPMVEGTGALTTSKNITLFWAQRRFTKTVPLDSKTNVGLTTTASGARSFRAFCATVNSPETKEMNIFTTHVSPDEENDESFQPKDPVEPDTQDETDQTKPVDEAMTEAPKTSLVDMGPITHVIPDNKEPAAVDPHDELLRWRYRLGHLPLIVSSNSQVQDSSLNIYWHARNPSAPLANTAKCLRDRGGSREKTKKPPKRRQDPGRLFWWISWNRTP